MSETRVEKASRKHEKLKNQSTLRKWLPTILICVVFDAVCIAAKGSFVVEDLSPLLLANAAFLLLNRSRMLRIANGAARHAKEKTSEAGKQRDESDLI